VTVEIATDLRQLGVQAREMGACFGVEEGHAGDRSESRHPRSRL
jgi:hypothetical protein